jgi:paraquat-inducible protein A
MKIKACHCCGLVHSVPNHDPQDQVCCVRCGTSMVSNVNRSQMQSRVAAFTIASLALFPAAVFLPILEVQRLGHHHRSSIVGGIWELLSQGSYFVGLIIFFFSIVFPLLKLTALLELTWLCALSEKHRATTYRWMELAGKWSMMDVMLLAFLVMMIKLSGLVEFHFGPAVIAFALCVSFSIIAALCFDPHAIWESA